MWTLIEKSLEQNKSYIVSIFSEKPNILKLVDSLNISIEKAEGLLKGMSIKTECGFYKLVQQ